MLVLSHRGFHLEHAENTLDAFAAAVALGVDGIETDVRLSADGLPVLFHDRAAPGGEPVASLTRAELAARTGHPVPLLEEALAAWPDLFWNLEIKAPEAAPATAAAVRRAAGRGRFLLSSFHHPVLAALGDGLGARLGLLVCERPLDVEALVRSARARLRLDAIVWSYETLAAEAVEEAARLGVESYVYGVETGAEHDRARALPLAGIITDRPDFLLGGRDGARGR